MSTLPLGKQAHFGGLDWDGMPSNEMERPDWSPMFKPPAAFWTSSLRDDGGTAWGDYLGGIDRSSGDACFVFEIVGDPRILVLRNDRDLEAAAKNLGLDVGDGMRSWRISSEMDQAFWRRVEAAYDAVHVPVEHDHYSVLNGWDCESTAWLRPADHLRLIEVRPLAEPDSGAEPSP